MTRALTLEDFAQAPVPSADPAPLPEPAQASGAPDEATLAAYDEGYRSGWEDCAKSEAENQQRIGADLAATLAELSLDHAAIRAEILSALGPLFEDIAARLLPSLAAEAIAPTVVAELRAAAERATQGPAVLVAAPAAIPALTRLVEMQEGLDIQLTAEPAFAENQVSLRFGDDRRDIDLGEAAGRMADAIRAFVAQDQLGAAAPDASPHADPEQTQKESPDV